VELVQLPSLRPRPREGEFVSKTAKDRNFFRKIARRESPIRFSSALPPDVDLDDIAWVPTREERQLAWLKEQKAKWDAEELAYYRKRCDELAIVVAADKAWIDRQNEIEAEMKKARDHYEAEHKKEEQAADRARRQKCLKLRKEINRDLVRAEREELIRRGIYKGRLNLNAIHVVA
jgi:hypothetical protein